MYVVGENVCIRIRDWFGRTGRPEMHNRLEQVSCTSTASAVGGIRTVLGEGVGVGVGADGDIRMTHFALNPSPPFANVPLAPLPVPVPVQPVLPPAQHRRPVLERFGQFMANLAHIPRRIRIRFFL